MKTTLYMKILLAYLLFGLISFFCIASVGSWLAQTYVEEDASESLYKEANFIAANYVLLYEENEFTLEDVQTHIQAIDVYLNADIWVLDRQGRILIRSSESGVSQTPSVIEEFDPVDMGQSYYTIGTFYDMFSEEMLSVMAPISSNLKTSGYVLIHTPMADLLQARDHILNITYICFLIFFGCSFLILLAFHFTVFRPLAQITRAVQEYSTGNFRYLLPVESNDELGRLSASLNYMAAGIGSAEEYQKKFIANISHDFRSPLTSIKGYVEAMLDGTIPPDMQEKYLNIVLFETDRLNKLTSGLLTLNSYDTKTMYLKKSDFDINSVIKNTAASFEGTCTARRISIQLLFEDHVQYVYADMGKIQQVLYNLIDNAIKFSHANSEIYVETTSKNDKVFISVKDTGIGIPKESIPKIWERFYKTDLSRGKDKKGTGLGLAITKEIIQAHGENINVISTEGVGTEFLFTLPLSKKVPASTPDRGLAPAQESDSQQQYDEA